jgi:putative nucleotidyltransferase with HDIG domain
VGFAALYLWPITLAARARGARGGIAVAAGAGALYLGHVTVREAGAMAAIVDEIAVVAGFVVAGGVAGWLASEAERRREERDRVLHAARRSEVRNALEALVEALGARDRELLDHSQRVADLAERLARRLDLGREQRAEIHLAGLLHDLGKLGLGDDILFSDGALSEDQRARVWDHPAHAAELVRAVGGDEALAAIVQAHHESPDGSGYPRGLRDDEIPLAAKVVKVADVFVALTEARLYRPPESAWAALSRLRAMAPAEVDESVVAALAGVLSDGWWQIRRETGTMVGVTPREEDFSVSERGARHA